MKRAHIVPLWSQVLKIIEAARSISGHKRYVFTSMYVTVRDSDEPMAHSSES